MSQLAFVACIRGWQWRRQRQRAAATSSSNDGNNNAQKGKTKRRKQVSHSGLNVRAPYPPPPDLSPPFHCQILLQQAIAAIGLARSGQATNVGSRRGVGRAGGWSVQFQLQLQFHLLQFFAANGNGNPIPAI